MELAPLELLGILTSGLGGVCDVFAGESGERDEEGWVARQDL